MWSFTAAPGTNKLKFSGHCEPPDCGLAFAARRATEDFTRQIKVAHKGGDLTSVAYVSLAGSSKSARGKVTSCRSVGDLTLARRLACRVMARSKRFLAR